jgi:hypothetical protein
MRLPRGDASGFPLPAFLPARRNRFREVRHFDRRQAAALRSFATTLPKKGAPFAGIKPALPTFTLTSPPLASMFLRCCSRTRGSS